MLRVKNCGGHKGGPNYEDGRATLLLTDGTLLQAAGSDGYAIGSGRVMGVTPLDGPHKGRTGGRMCWFCVDNSAA